MGWVIYLTGATVQSGLSRDNFHLYVQAPPHKCVERNVESCLPSPPGS
jgi:hypothetical protein